MRLRLLPATGVWWTLWQRLRGRVAWRTHYWNEDDLAESEKAVVIARSARVLAHRVAMLPGLLGRNSDRIAVTGSPGREDSTMSHITEVLIHGAGTKNVEALNAWLREADTERGQQFERIDMDAAGGSKFYASEVWAAAFNYGPVELIEKLRDPETWKGCLLSVGLLIDGENQSEAFFFDGSERDGYRPVMRQDWWA